MDSIGTTSQFGAMAIKLEKLYWLRHILHRREMAGLMLYRGSAQVKPRYQALTTQQEGKRAAKTPA